MSKLFCFHSEKGSTPKGKNLLPNGSKFFPFRVDLSSEGTQCAVEQTGSHISYLPCKNSRKATMCIQPP